ncbi:hypothetical protein I317_07266 [Kwoniella heveanensis CBS 569]|nr:hypothetical protein I317_07266 [Kwoniella heveanensis CBS 569]
MMYNPYQWGGGMMGGNQGYNPYMMAGGSPAQSTMAGGAASASGQSQGELAMKPFDSSKMKQGRMGHYGYLEGRELAGPPVGYMPAGMQPQMSGSQASQISPSRAASAAAPNSTVYFPGGSTTGSAAGGSSAMAWGDPANTPRARWDGSSSAQGYVQADLDTPYPRTAGGGASSAFTRYGPDGSIINGVDGRMGIGHRRMREGGV